MQLPNWNSLEDVARLNDYLKVATILCACVAALLGILAYKINARKETLAGLQQEQERQAHANEIQRLRAAIPKPIITGSVLLEVRDRYTDKLLTHITCTTDKGTAISPGRKIEMPVGPFSAECTHPGYFSETFTDQIKDGETMSKRVTLEQETGSVRVTVLTSDGTDVSEWAFISVNGKNIPHHPYHDDPKNHVVAGLRARTTARVTALEYNGSVTIGQTDRRIRWASAAASNPVTVLGGTAVTVTVTVPLLDPETGKPL